MPRSAANDPAGGTPVSSEMGDERWLEVDALFQAALDLPPPDRLAFLKRTCGDDPGLRAAVESLLEAEADSSGFLRTPVDEVVQFTWEALTGGDRESATEVDEAPPDRSGETVGPYRLVRRLGRGGMATVYLAERADGQWDQQVAFKVIRRGLDTKEMIRRFLAERQILSSLNHPNIARFYDGGTTPDHLPYLVIEHVAGTPITEYCDEHRLSVDERLTLFCDVGRAVAHAHRSLVVHRDLKPSNILVDGEGRVKLLDFGIAKLLDPAGDGNRTRTGFQPLTPDYASPEQVAGDAVTTASDVYQLGMLLCELLSGSRPYEVRALSPARMEQLIATAEPSHPSTMASSEAAAARGTSPEGLARRLRGDLDTVVLKALRKEPERRYASAEAMVADVERHVAGLPISARPDTVGYRLGKLVRRRPWLVPAAALLLLLAGGYVFTLERYANELERERNLARAEAERAEEVQRFLTGVFRSADPFAPADPERGRLITVQEALGLGSERVRTELEDRPALRASLLGAISEVYSNLGQIDSARVLREEALAVERAQHGADSREAIVGMRKLGRLLIGLGDRDSADALLLSGLELARTSYGPADTLAASFLVDLGLLDTERGDFESAEARTREAITILSAQHPPARERLIDAYQSLAEIHGLADRPEASWEAVQEAVRLSREVYGEEHPRTGLATTQLADAYDWVGRDAEAVEVYRQAIGVLERTLGPDHFRALEARNNLAVTFLDLGDNEAAEDELRHILDPSLSADVTPQERTSWMQNLAAALSRQGKYDEAEVVLREVYDLYVETLEPGHYLTAFPLLTLTGNQLERSQYGAAEETVDRALAILREALPPGHFVTVVAECRRARALAGLGRRAEARSLLEASVSTLDSSTSVAPTHRLECLRALGDVYEAQGENAAAVEVRGRIAELEAASG